MRWLVGGPLPAFRDQTSLCPLLSARVRQSPPALPCTLRCAGGFGLL